MTNPSENDDDSGEPAADVILAPQWVFRVGARDALLILKALGGRLTEEEDDAALLLCDRLTALRQRHGEGLARALDHACDGMEEARAARGLEPSPLAGRRRGGAR